MNRTVTLSLRPILPMRNGAEFRGDFACAMAATCWTPNRAPRALKTVIALHVAEPIRRASLGFPARPSGYFKRKSARYATRMVCFTSRTSDVPACGRTGQLFATRARGICRRHHTNRQGLGAGFISPIARRQWPRKGSNSVIEAGSGKRGRAHYYVARHPPPPARWLCRGFH